MTTLHKLIRKEVKLCMNNRICRYLAHSSTADIEKAKGLRRNAISDHNKWGQVDWDIEGLSKPTKEQLDKESDLYSKANESEKALANHEWYMHNKDKKKEYNKEYYQANKDYWERRYNEARGKLDASMKENTERYNSGDKSYTRKGEDLSVETGISQINYDRAVKEYDDFITKTSATQTHVSDFSSPSRKSLIDRGVNLFASIVKPITGLLAAIFGSK